MQETPAAELLELSRLVLSRLDLDAGDRGESVYLPAALRDRLRDAVNRAEAESQKEGVPA